jgi:hypothetical protein
MRPRSDIQHVEIERRGKNMGSQAQPPITWLRSISLPSLSRLPLMAPSLQFGILLWQVSDEGKVSRMYTARKKINDKGVQHFAPSSIGSAPAPAGQLRHRQLPRGHRIQRMGVFSTYYLERVAFPFSHFPYAHRCSCLTSILALRDRFGSEAMMTALLLLPRCHQRSLLVQRS